MIPGLRTCLFDEAQLAVLLDNMAERCASLLRGRQRVAVIGIRRRGAPLADRLTERLIATHGMAPPLRLDLLVKRYADDLTLLHPETQLTEQAQHATLDLSGYTLLLVDDVLYTGHSILKVLNYLVQKQPAAIRVAVLAERAGRCLPLAADVVGTRLEIAPTDIIECHVPPFESDFRIELLQPARATRADEQDHV
ncbi:phosphoribosyltransferase family protein [Vogesella sp. LYT5W]|uniref:Phosphoribosyltransferase family protein n=1 Tax=Vogesella margarita TaxID=2984199 RepID=A0ABT5IT92_9NEIS|nr:phosphoribosyltransferase family protein [Vogesella margarita]MDC7715490.1 phosphoribosyltransferase family protein [Vogesella margarita]